MSRSISSRLLVMSCLVAALGAACGQITVAAAGDVAVGDDTLAGPGGDAAGLTDVGGAGEVAGAETSAGDAGGPTDTAQDTWVDTAEMPDVQGDVQPGADSDAGTAPACTSDGDCDDKNPCTQDTCDTSNGACAHTPGADDVPCGDAKCDGLTFVGQRTCYQGTCLPGAKSACDDQNPCTDDTCDGANGCQHSKNTSKCEDGNACTKGDVCAGGVCTAGEPLECADADPCTSDSCAPDKGCVHVPVADDTPCANPKCDGQIFTKGSTCKSGTCVPSGGPTSCNDNNPCTEDVCTPQSGCTHQTLTGPCEDVDPCTTGDLCISGICTPGKPVLCNDNNPCTKDFCDAGKGCISTPVEGTCDDGDLCSTADACVDGMCKGQPVDCDDADLCTQDVCIAGAGCDHVVLDGTSCDDGTGCSIGATCVSGVCEGGGGTSPICNDYNPCTIDKCLASGGCDHVPAKDGLACGAAACEGNLYVGPAVCAGGLCGAPPKAVSCADANPCTNDACNPDLGCLHTAVTDVACNDGNACTGPDLCAKGSCGGAPLDCDDKNPCTDDACDPAKGCANTPNKKPCDDGNSCTIGDVCVGGSCLTGKPVACDDGNPCTNDACDPTAGCTHSATAEGSPCGEAKCNGLTWTGPSTCAAGLCAPGKAVACDDGSPCTLDTCAATGCTAKPAGFGAPCAMPSGGGGFCGKTACTGIEFAWIQPDPSSEQAEATAIDRSFGDKSLRFVGWSYGLEAQASDAVMMGLSDGGLDAYLFFNQMGALRYLGVEDRLVVGQSLKGTGATLLQMPNNGYSAMYLGSLGASGPLTAVNSAWTGGAPGEGDQHFFAVGQVPDGSTGGHPAIFLRLLTKGGVEFDSSPGYIAARNPMFGDCNPGVGLPFASFHDVYAASTGTVYAAGTWMTGGKTESVVVRWDGDLKVGCPGYPYIGEAFPVVQQPFDPAGNFGVPRCVVGPGDGSIFVGGTKGLLLQGAPGGIDPMAPPKLAAMPFPWGTGYDVRSATATETDLFVGGNFQYKDCRAAFVLHAVRDGKYWIWDTFLAPPQWMTCVASNPVQPLTRVWYDAVTNALFLVGTQTVNDSGQPVTDAGAFLQRMALGRIKL